MSDIKILKLLQQAFYALEAISDSDIEHDSEVLDLLKKFMPVLVFGISPNDLEDLA